MPDWEYERPVVLAASGARQATFMTQSRAKKLGLAPETSTYFIITCSESIRNRNSTKIEKNLF